MNAVDTWVSALMANIVVPIYVLSKYVYTSKEG